MSPLQGPHRRSPSENYLGFCRDLWPPGTHHHWAFHLHPKSHFNYTPGEGSLQGVAFWGKKSVEKTPMNSGKNPYEQSNNPDVTEETPVPASDNRPC